MRSEILICKDKQNRIVDCKDIEFPVGSEYKPGTINLWTEWVGGKGKSCYCWHYIKIGSEMVTEPCPLHQERCCTQCLQGQRLSKSNNICWNCPAGFECKNPIYFGKMKCQPGYYSGSRDTVCIQCPPGTSCPDEEMVKPGDCPDKKNCMIPAKPFDCNAGYKCVGGIVSKCGEGKWSMTGKIPNNRIYFRSFELNR